MATINSRIQRFVDAALMKVPQPIRDKITAALSAKAKSIAQEAIAAVYGKALMKGTDTVISIGAKRLLRTEDGQFVGEADLIVLRDIYVRNVRQQATEMGNAVETYSVAQHNVEVAKAKYGESSPEAVAARKARGELKAQFRKEVSDVLTAVLGED